MNGISLMMPISCCPMYNLGTSNNINLIPRRLSNLHLRSISPPPLPLATTTRMLKHRVYSASSSSGDQDAKWLRPEVGGTVVPYGLLGLGVSGLALLKAGEVVAQLISTRGGAEGNRKLNPRYKSILTRVAISLVARCVGGKIQDWLPLVISPSFSIGDVIQIVSNKSRPHAVVSKIYVQVDGIGKIDAISEEIENMMKSNSNVYLEDEQPYCCISGFEPHYVKLTLVYNLKQMCKDKLNLAKHDILMQSTQIIMKHDATLA